MIKFSLTIKLIVEPR